MTVSYDKFNFYVVNSKKNLKMRFISVTKSLIKVLTMTIRCSMAFNVAHFRNLVTEFPFKTRLKLFDLVVIIMNR